MRCPDDREYVLQRVVEREVSVALTRAILATTRVSTSELMGAGLAFRRSFNPCSSRSLKLRRASSLSALSSAAAKEGAKVER